MTREEFDNDITYLSELIGFCYEVDCDVLEGIRTDLSDAVEEDLAEAVQRLDWRTIRDRLNDIDGYLDYFTCGDDWLTYYNAEDEFEYYKGEVRDWCLDNDAFDAEEEEEEEPEEPEYGRGMDRPYDTEPQEPMDIAGFFDMIDSGIVDVSDILEKRRIEEEESRKEHELRVNQRRAQRQAAVEATRAADTQAAAGIMDFFF